MNTLVMNSFRQSIQSEQEQRAKLVQAEKMSAAGNLLAGLVHELNNPLTTILGFSELLLNEDALKSDRIRTIHAEAARSVRVGGVPPAWARRRIGDRTAWDYSATAVCKPSATNDIQVAPGRQGTGPG